MENLQRESIDICILIPCYNNTAGLIQSIKSIVYPPAHFMVLVIDDGSAIAVTREILYQHLPITVNIRIERLQHNAGITAALNKGLDVIYANYAVKFIARLDCGDTCLPERFIKQVAFLENNPGIDLLGSWCHFKDKDTGATYQFCTPTQHKLIEQSMYFRNAFIHPTVMWRAAALAGWKYPANFPHAEDYGLFYDIITKKRTAILDDFLVVCEINKEGISLRNRSAQLKSRLKVIWDYGENKLLVAAGTLKLLLLMIVPYQFLYRIKRLAFNSRQVSYRKL